jgi:hypothetical protein
MNNGARSHDELDKEWVDLVVTARQMGLTIEELREFLHNRSMNTQDNRKNE